MGYSNNKSYTEVIKIKEHREVYKRLFGGVKRQDIQLIAARGCGKTPWLRMFYDKAIERRKIAEDINKELCFGDNIYRELALRIDQRRGELIQEAKLNV